MQNTTQGWHTSNWGTLGWIETALKLIGLVAGIIAGVGALSATTSVGMDTPRTLALIVGGLMTLLVVVTLVIRYGQKEIVSMAFAVVNLVGHLGVLATLLRTPDQRTLLIVFGVFFFLGVLVQIQFFRTTGYTESGRSSASMLQFAGFLAVLYAVFTVLMLV